MGNVEKFIDLFQSSKCKHWFLDNADMMWLANYLVDNGAIIADFGYWIKNDDDTYFCSACGHDEVYTYDGTRVLSRFCPFCNSIMKIREDAEDS